MHENAEEAKKKEVVVKEEEEDEKEKEEEEEEEEKDEKDDKRLKQTREAGRKSLETRGSRRLIATLKQLETHSENLHLLLPSTLIFLPSNRDKKKKKAKIDHQNFTSRTKLIVFQNCI